MSVVEDNTKDVVIVANRLPYEIVRDHGDIKVVECVSGLVTVLQNVLTKDCEHNVLWIGGLVKSPSFLEEAQRLRAKKESIRPVPIPERSYKTHRCWSNEKLWPTFHEQLEYVENLPNEVWKGYKEVNEVFAQEILKSVNRKDHKSLIWIHDFQLFLVPKLVRQMMSQDQEIKIGFFLHIPFPKQETFEKLEHFEEILKGMLGSNVIAFHTTEYCLNFLKCCQKLLDCRVDLKTIKVNFQDREILVRAIPAGISYKTVSSYSTGVLSQECPVRLKDLCTSSKGKKLIIGVDRIDYTKGLLEKTRAFQTILRQFPNLDKQLIYIQIAVPTRSENASYKRLQSDLYNHVNRINNELYQEGFSSSIDMVLEKVSRQDLAVLYRKARVALVTPLRDGLNLVAMEYIASQSSHSPGVLVLSEFAGAAKTLHEAVKVFMSYNVKQVHILTRNSKNLLSLLNRSSLTKCRVL